MAVAALDCEGHARYLRGLAGNRDLFGDGEHIFEHLALPGAYWCLAALDVLGEALGAEERAETLTWLGRCRRLDGGYGGAEGHDSNLLSTLYALLVLLTLDEPLAEAKLVVRPYVLSLFDPKSGGFRSDVFGDVDGRTTYAGIYCLYILEGDIPAAAGDFLLRCANIDGGFGGKEGAESHAAYTFCAVSGLKLMGRDFDVSGCSLFLSRRQTADGGLNGRPEKLPDVCYSWWVLSSLAVMRCAENVDGDKLVNFILRCQQEKGGFGDRPGNQEDVFHTFFALAALALIDHRRFCLNAVDPFFSLTESKASSLRTRLDSSK